MTDFKNFESAKIGKLNNPLDFKKKAVSNDSFLQLYSLFIFLLVAARQVVVLLEHQIFVQFFVLFLPHR